MVGEILHGLVEEDDWKYAVRSITHAFIRRHVAKGGVSDSNEPIARALIAANSSLLILSSASESRSS